MNLSEGFEDSRFMIATQCSETMGDVIPSPV